MGEPLGNALSSRGYEKRAWLSNPPCVSDAKLYNFEVVPCHELAIIRLHYRIVYTAVARHGRRP